MRKSWKLGGIAAVVLLVGGAGVAVMASKGDGPKKPDDDKAKTVLEFVPSEVVKPTLTAMPALIEFSGPLVAPGTVIVRAKSNGTLLNLAVGEGSRVKAGQALGQVDLEELRYRIAERGASVEAMRAQMEQAERSYKANEGLAAKSFIAQTALDNSRAAYESARANWNAAKAQLDTSQVTMRQAALVAPINGIVAKRHALPGEKLAAEQQILTIVDLSKLELAGLVGTHEVSRLQPGMAVQVQVEGVDEPVQAKIARIAPSAEPGTRSIGVTLVLDNPRELYRAGQYAVAKVVLQDDTQRLTVPLAAISRNSGQEQVWMIEKGALVRRIVTTGRSDAQEGRVEILNGLKPEAQVLAARFDNLREGDKATVVATKAKVASSAATPVQQ
ncbi:efflux RND transporter periplasmic adaptor subunit [Roseateles saccharophilus]|uniref:RND family efflux transporter MFP subunit n=1 Tax=Roseateles saccharophilus TaxID=304 RepID=A0A4R3VFE9_ROSSA|nr:efflux RND transporter periplasmic adaptor subunit [Roseateles saccharophilus]MDG0832181.1 efflux RND transporter periplasmic adaptor subunit [Roseateles saccharophilus]TCV02444.1 RND family efflux transporter MFP subunit [Roseateles saccharophilus]